MSEYFRVLKRIERDQPDTTARPARSSTARHLRSQPSSAVSRPVRHQPASSAVALPAGADAAFAKLFDNIRTLANGNPVRALVFAGASASEPVRAVMSGLSAQVESRGLTVVTGNLSYSDGHPMLRSRSLGVAASSDESVTAVRLDLAGPDAAVELTAWLQETDRVADLVLIEGRSLDQSVDAALLARSCDGLVIVATTEMTAREALTSAAERAKAVGCRTFGLVLRSSPDHMPRWLRRLIPRPRLQLPVWKRGSDD